MPESDKPLRIFVAMPGNLGKSSRYASSESVRTNFLEPIRRGVQERLNNRVELYIEKEKLTTGGIHASMFAEAMDADVYIADLTNSNPNVYLELGVRWALRDGLTIPICQNPEDLKFNVGSSRAFQYTPDNVSDQANKLAQMIVDYLNRPRSDSPVRDSLELVTVAKSHLADLENEIQRLRSSCGEDLFAAAKAQTEPGARLELLKQAVSANPAFVDALLDLGILQREMSDYAASERSLKKAVTLNPKRPQTHRELGVLYSKLRRLPEAVSCFESALSYDDKDGETWSNLGGALRREATAADPTQPDRVKLEKSREAYAHASKLDDNNLYPALNACRLDLLLARWEPARLTAAVAEFRRRRPLCEWQVAQAPNDYWRKFDLAEAMLFSSSKEAALQAYRAALEGVPVATRADVLSSVRAPLADYKQANILPSELAAVVADVLALLGA